MNIDTTLAERFDLTVPEEPPTPPVPLATESVAVVPAVQGSDIDIDAQKARETIHKLIDKSVAAFEDLIKVAKASEKARDYEVAGQLLKAAADMSKDLLAVQKVKRELQPTEEEGPKKTSIGTQQNIFVGSTNDLLRALAAAGMTSGKPAPMEIQNAEIVSTT